MIVCYFTIREAIKVGKIKCMKISPSLNEKK